MSLASRLLSGSAVFGGIVSISGGPAPIALDDGPADLQLNTGNHDIDVLANDIYSGAPTISIQGQSGPGTATVVEGPPGSGAAAWLIRIPTDGLSEGTKVVTYQLTDDVGSDTADLTVVLVATAPPPPIPIGALTAFQSSRIQVTTLAGWPAGRTPKEVVTQGTHAHGYVRRSWKPTSNDGTWMDFQAGWRKTTSAGTIRIKLDDNSELDLSYTVAHSIPAPGAGGTTRTLDKLGGGNFTTWSTAVAALATNDVLVVRALAGGEVYPLDTSAQGPVSTVSGVKVVAHPDDLAAGRRPRIHVHGTLFAKYADELGAGHWTLHQNLGGSHGTVWKTASTFSDPVRYGVSYRTKGGYLRRLWAYGNTDGQSIAMSRLLDTTYPRINTTGPVSSWTLYMGPGIYWNSSDARFYIRLTPLTSGIGATQVNGAPNPPWDWSDDDPVNADPNQCQLYFSKTENQSVPGNTRNYCIDISNRTGWLFENIDFVGGGGTIKGQGSAFEVRGCRILGWAPPWWNDASNEDTFDNEHQMLDIGGATVTVDRCEFWGGAVPWGGWDENKQRHGSYSGPQKSNLVNPRAGTASSGSVLFRHCVADGFWTVSRNSGGIGSVKLHHCRLRYFGMDGSWAMEIPASGMDYLRCQLLEATAFSPLGAGADGGNLHMGYCLWVNVRPYMHPNGWWTSNTDRDNEFVPGGAELAHGALNWFARQRLYNNTGIGAHNHRCNNIAKVSGSGMTHDGNGSSMHPWCRMEAMVEFQSRNNIAAVFPNGSQGDINSHPIVGGGSSGDSHAAYVMHASHLRPGGSTHAQNYNIYWRAPGMPSVSFSGTVTTVNLSSLEQARTTIAQVQGDTGQEANGRIADPGFAQSFVASALDSVVHRNAQWVLTGTGATAASGGDTTDRSWPDVDFGADVTYGGQSWLGCMDPQASAVEQQVGPLGPMPSG